MLFESPHTDLVVMRDVDAGEFGVRTMVSKMFIFTMVRNHERCLPDFAGQELCQLGLDSVPRPRKSKSVEASTKFVPIPERIFSSSLRWNEEQGRKNMLGSGKGVSL
jgi:hypothetical protein